MKPQDGVRQRKVFVLGDSRTGTTTLHKFLKLAGFKSIHYFFEQSGVEKPAHKDFEKNWNSLRTFIDSSGYVAFSDYPLRTFYERLFEAYPDAHYILSVRKDVKVWRDSMQGFFSKFNVTIDIDALEKLYLNINESIRRISAEGKFSFLEVCIDDDADENGRRLSEFLNLEAPLSLGWENKTESYDNRLWSTRVTLFDTGSDQVLDYVKRVTQTEKSMLSEHGWVFLINDSSKFMDYAFGNAQWTPEQADRASSTLMTRSQLLAELGADYFKFIVPEKAVVYSEYLPKVFSRCNMNENRPAKLLEGKQLPFVYYFESLLKDVRSLGQVYFRGDTHTNWFGAFFLYQAIVGAINDRISNKSGFKTSPPFALSQFRPFLASYGGDIFTQLDKESRAIFDGAWQQLNLGDKLEHLVGYELRAEYQKAKRLEVESDYLTNLGERETFRFSHPNKALPRAVIFRDSTADYLVEPLSQHFSESLFIWHKGFAYGDVVERERPDVVLHVMAERFLTQYTEVLPLANLLPRNTNNS